MRRILLAVNFVLCLRGTLQMDFPKDFLFGAASAAYQIEGGWNASGKGQSIWDHYNHNHPDYAVDGSNGDVACDSYHKVVEDVQLLAGLGVHVYRFSISWSRILPTGFTSEVNPDGMRYYNLLINELVKHNITPFVTLLHFDIPQPLQEIGGWTNPLLVQYYTTYARTVFELFGDRVKFWITFNEPALLCSGGYSGLLAPAYNLSGIGDYLCAHTVLKSHAQVYHLYRQEFKTQQKGQIGIALSPRWLEPKSQSSQDREAALRAWNFEFGWFAHPLVKGDYPPIMRDRIDRLSQQEYFVESRLPKFTLQETAMICGSYDFLGINHYTTVLVSATKGDVGPAPSYDRDISIRTDVDPDWQGSAADWLYVVPWGLYKALMYIKEEYGNPTVYITENGFPDLGEMEDLGRINYLQEYLENLSQAIADGCNVKGYITWSLMDSYEWFQGYRLKFGLHHVNFTDEAKTSVP